MYDYLIVGAGLYGATMARYLFDHGRTVAVIEARSGPAGNCADEYQDGIRVQLHGGHIFHTNDDGVWSFVNRFCDWQRYEHRVTAEAQGRRWSFPVNLQTLNQMWGVTSPAEAEKMLADHGRVREIRRLFFEGYTAKQWGRPIEQVPESVLARIPMRKTWDDRYFTDTYQALPIGGYTELVRAMLTGIQVAYNCPFKLDEYWPRKVRRIIYTGPLDALYDYRYSELEYRSLRFEHNRMGGDYQGIATVNYCDADVPYTRILEHKHFGHQQHAETVVTHEYPRAYINGVNERYYPVGGDNNKEIHSKYMALAESDNLIVGGRLGLYKYLDMDKTIRLALDAAAKI